MKLYKITNMVNGKIYIGVTKKELRERFTEHCSLKSGCTYLRNAIQKYGKCSFKIECLYVGDKEDILQMEMQYINDLGSYKSDIGYNIVSSYSDTNSMYSGNKTDVLGQSVYVHGFWIPAKKVACKLFSVGHRMLNKHIALGFNLTHYDFEVTRKYNMKNRLNFRKPCTIEGVDYPSRKEAAKILKVTDQTIRKYLQYGNYQMSMSGFMEMNRKEAAKCLSVRMKQSHPRSHTVIVHGIIYNSIREAVDQTGYTKRQIQKHLNDPNNTDFEYLNNEET